MKKQTIGLFGTCGNSTWREEFINKYKELGIEFFNPQLGPGEWNPACAEVEAKHLAKDEILLVPITDETTALGSLSEIGFSVLNAIKLDDRRDFIVMITPDVNDTVKESDPQGAIDSQKSRALVREHLKKLNFPNVYLVDTLEEMLECSVTVHSSNEIKAGMNKYSVKARNIQEIIEENS